MATLLAVEAIANRLPVLFPAHPRTTARIEQLGLKGRLEAIANLYPVPPLGYKDFVTLMAHAKLIATDSGGIQEESTALGVPCLTLRDSTERPETVAMGVNVVAGLDPARVTEAVAAMRGKRHAGLPIYGDGAASARILDGIAERVAVRERRPA